MANLGLLRVGLTGLPTLKNYWFRGSLDLYQADDIKAVTLIYPAANSELGNIPHRVSDLLLGGVIIKIVATCGTTLKPRRIPLICSTRAVNNVRNKDGTGLIGKTLGQYGVIRSVNVKRDMVIR